MGVYKFDFLSDLRINSAYLPYTERQDDKICSLAGHPAGWLFQFTSLSDIPAFKVEVKGIVNDNFTYRWYDENGNRGADIAINEDGIYELPMSYSVETNTGVGIVCNNLCQDNVCFTQIPDYPNQLCYSGKETLIAYDIPLLTDFTVIAKRKWLNVNKGTFIVYGSPLSSGINGSAFGFELIDVSKTKLIYSFNKAKLLDNFYEKDISYMNSINYNGIDIVKGGIPNTKNTLAVGNYTNDKRYGFIGCHDDIIILKRSLTIDEINNITEAIFNETIIEEQTNNTSKP